MFTKKLMLHTTGRTVSIKSQFHYWPGLVDIFKSLNYLFKITDLYFFTNVYVSFWYRFHSQIRGKNLHEVTLSERVNLRFMKHSGVGTRFLFGPDTLLNPKDTALILPLGERAEQDL